ncbi:MAG: nucleotide exchange factor GrpE [Methylacidiphilales bacterium]|nr:nucleotide exchange factor GrpE [Candidatus Methylacidiphilales bacterium]
MSSKDTKKEEMKSPEAAATPAYVVVSNDLFQSTAALAAQAAELKDRLLRSQAEWDNSRKRIQKEKEEAVRYAAEALLEKLLPVLDNFEMGVQAARTATDAKAVAQGFEMVQSQLNQVLREAGVEPIDAVGHPFDPHRHEALGHHESEEHPEGHVMTQLRKGYKLKDRLLRPASVFVAKPPEGKQA